VVAFGNDGFATSAKARFQVVELVKMLDKAGIDVAGFGISKDGYSWTLLAACTNTAQLFTMVWDAWEAGIARAGATVDDGGAIRCYQENVAKSALRRNGYNLEPETVPHLLVYWLAKNDVRDWDFRQTARFAAKQSEALSKLKADGWNLVKGMDKDVEGGLVGFIATHTRVKSVEDARKRLRKLRIGKNVGYELRDEPLNAEDLQAWAI
jgi:hypothetical protein